MWTGTDYGLAWYDDRGEEWAISFARLDGGGERIGGDQPITDEEELYRRIPVSTNWYDPETDPWPSPKAFRPLKGDTTGLSVEQQVEAVIRLAVERGAVERGDGKAVDR